MAISNRVAFIGAARTVADITAVNFYNRSGSSHNHRRDGTEVGCFDEESKEEEDNGEHWISDRPKVG